MTLSAVWTGVFSSSRVAVWGVCVVFVRRFLKAGLRRELDFQQPTRETKKTQSEAKQRKAQGVRLNGRRTDSVNRGSGFYTSAKPIVSR